MIQSILRSLRATLIASAAVGFNVALAQVPSIYADIGSLGYGSGVPSSSFAAAGPQPGMWNAVDTDQSAGLTDYTTPPLMDTAGTATAVTMTLDSIGMTLNTINFDEPFSTGDDQALIDDGSWVGAPNEVRFDGLPAGEYDVLTYAIAPDDDLAITIVNVVGSVDPQQDVGGDFSAGYALGITHAKHTVTVVAGQPLVIQLDVGSAFDTVSGVQLFPAGAAPGFGTNYCGPANANSTGASAEISATGSAVVGANDVTLTASNLPTNSFGFFITSATQGFVANPAGSAGNLCLGGAIGRYVGAGQIQSSGQAGEFSLQLDLTMVPQPNGFISVVPGQRLNFQAWYRDAVGGTATSNFSDGIDIGFL